MEHPTISTPCNCHYAGRLLDGTEFDSSYARGTPSTFAPNQVIAGWTEAMQLMHEGDKWELFINADLGYGERGTPGEPFGARVLKEAVETLESLVELLMAAARRVDGEDEGRGGERQRAALLRE